MLVFRFKLLTASVKLPGKVQLKDQYFAPITIENREYLTKKVNDIFELISVFVGANRGIGNEKTHQNIDGFF
jgi:hypothetical protein